MAFARLEEGYENAIKDYNKKQVRGASAQQGAGAWGQPHSREQARGRPEHRALRPRRERPTVGSPHALPE